jgi:hypothetical protein
VRRAGEPALSTGAREERANRVEIVATLLLALAAVGTAWGSYQASRWNGEQAKAFSRGNTARIESTRASSLATAQKQVDVATFMQWVNAYALDQKRLADFYARRFRNEFKPAVDAWIATRPVQNPKAPLTPFVMPQYELAASREAARLEAQADAWSAKGRTDVQRATNYVLGVVLFAASLFFAGMSAKLRTHGLRVALVSIGAAIFVGAAVWLATQPTSISI